MAPSLEIVSGPLSGRRFAIGPQGARLGRSSSNDISVPDEAMSRNHGLLEIARDSSVRLTDLASANGTYVNGEPLGNDPVTLRPGDVILAGDTQFRLVVEEA